MLKVRLKYKRAIYKTINCLNLVFINTMLKVFKDYKTCDYMLHVRIIIDPTSI